MHSSLFFLFSLLSLFLTLLTPALASNAIIFRNRCTHPIYVFEVGPGLPGNEDQAIAIPGGGNHTYAMRNTEALGAGIALKIRDVPQYRVAPSGILQAEYHLEPSTARIWYDLSFIDCEPSAGPTDPRFCPLREGGVRMHVPGREDEGCLPAECGPEGGCKLVYLQHGSWFGEPTLSCGVGVDIHVETCLNSDGRRTLLPSLNAPVPDSSAAPISPPAQNPLAVSPNGLCGRTLAYTCAGSSFGQCCSRYNYCGDDAEHCAAGCQSDFGTCASGAAVDAEQVKEVKQVVKIKEVLRVDKDPEDEVLKPGDNQSFASKQASEKESMSGI